MVTVAVVDAGDAARRRAKQLPLAFHTLQFPCHSLFDAGTDTQNLAFTSAGGCDSDHIGEGRVSAQTAQLDLRFLESVIILQRGAADHIVLRCVCLNIRSSLLISPTGSSNNLS